MNSIVKAEEKDAQLLSEIAKPAFIESHGNSAKPEDINIYITEKLSKNAFEKELDNEKNIYYILYYNTRPVGYSKIIFNAPYKNCELKNITKLEQIYLLKEFYDLKLGLQLLEFNIELSKQNNQIGMWLFVWKENHRAINFYKKNGFLIIGNYDYKISENHSNPNHQMFLKF